MYKCKLLIGRCEYQFGGNKCAAETPCENRGLSFPDDRLADSERKECHTIKLSISNSYLKNAERIFPHDNGESYLQNIAKGLNLKVTDYSNSAFQCDTKPL